MSRYGYSQFVRYKALDGTLFQMHEGSCTTRTWNEENVVCHKSDLAGDQDDWYTHGTAFENAACSSSCYVQKARASRARVVVLSGSLGLGGKGFLYDEG